MMYMYIVHKGHDETLILYVHIQLYISVQRGESVRPGVYIVYQQWLVCVCVCVCMCEGVADADSSTWWPR